MPAALTGVNLRPASGHFVVAHGLGPMQKTAVMASRGLNGWLDHLWWPFRFSDLGATVKDASPHNAPLPSRPTGGAIRPSAASFKTVRRSRPSALASWPVVIRLGVVCGFM